MSHKANLVLIPLFLALSDTGIRAERKEKLIERAKKMRPKVDEEDLFVGTMQILCEADLISKGLPLPPEGLTGAALERHAAGIFIDAAETFFGRGIAGLQEIEKQREELAQKQAEEDASLKEKEKELADRVAAEKERIQNGAPTEGENDETPGDEPPEDVKAPTPPSKDDKPPNSNFLKNLRKSSK